MQFSGRALVNYVFDLCPSLPSPRHVYVCVCVCTHTRMPVWAIYVRQYLCIGDLHFFVKYA